jgi:alkylated DNA nucleotide flippase Atl1
VHTNAVLPAEKLSAEVLEFVKTIPCGKVMSYGDIAKIFRIVPLHAGRIMRLATTDIPWWRVVGADGGFPTAKLNPEIAQKQRDLLVSEKVPFTAKGLVNMKVARLEVEP